MLFNFIHILFQQFFFMSFALAIPPTQFIVHEQLNLLYQIWIHTEVTLNNRITPLISYSYSVLINLVHWNIFSILHHIIEFIMVRWYHYNDFMMTCTILNLTGINRYCIDKNFGMYLINMAVSWCNCCFYK